MGSEGGNWFCFLPSPSHFHTLVPNLALATDSDMPKIHAGKGKGWPCLSSLTSRNNLISIAIIYVTKAIDQQKLNSSRCLPLSISGLRLVALFLYSFSLCSLFPLLKTITIQCSSCLPCPQYATYSSSVIL